MAEDVSSTTLRLDLDAEDFKKQVGEINEKLDSIHGETHTIGVATMFTAFAEGANIAGEALHKLGEAAEWIFDKILDAEKINGINFQFEQLTKNAGLSSEKLREGFEQASKGMVPMAEIINAANKAILGMGVSAEKLPELFEMARKSAAISGHDTIEVFNSLARSIGTGTTRLLRQEGIYLNQKKIMEQYAESVGASNRELSEQEKHQAVLNALLEFGNNKLASTPGDLKQVTVAWKQFSTAITELGEVFSSVVSRLIGPTMARIIDVAKGMASSLSGLVTAAFGTEIQKAAQNTKTLELQLGKLNRQADYFKSIISKDIRPEAIEGARRSLEFTNKLIDETTKKLANFRKVAGGSGLGGSKGKDEEKDKLIAEEHKKSLNEMAKQDKAYADMKLGLDKQTANDYEKTQKTESDAKKASVMRAKIIDQEYLLDKKKINDLGLSDHKKTDDLLLSADKKKKAALLASEKKYQADVKKLEKSTFDYKAAAQQAFSSNYISSIQDMVSGQKDGSEAIKGFFLGALGDMATQQGAFMVLDSFSTFPAVKVPELAAGGGLIALGAALGGMAGGSSGATAISSSGGYSSPDFTEKSLAPPTTAAPESLAANAAPRSSVTIAVAGNYFETEETKRRLAEIIREHQDATDFTFKQIGQA